MFKDLLFITLMTPLMVLAAATPGLGGEPKIIDHSLVVTVDLAKRRLEGSDTLTFRNDGELRLYLREGSAVDAIVAGGAGGAWGGEGGGGPDIDYRVRKVQGGPFKEVIIKTPGAGGGEELTLRVDFHGAFRTVEEAQEDIKRGVAHVDEGVMGLEGAFIPASSYWYPRELEGFASFDVTVTAPGGYTTVTGGQWLESVKTAHSSTDRWRSERPTDGVDLVVGSYHVERDEFNGIDVYTFFFEADKALSELYIGKTKEYLTLYAGLFGPYPFTKFAVVESFLPTGYGMPSYTLLGSSVLRLPFIPDTSLGHEIAHSWWGNSVFVDDSLGNWAEALTTHTADYLYEKRKGAEETSEFRFKNLQGYKNFAGKDPIALKDFNDSARTETRAVGYNKGTMVFLMLEDLLGEEVFTAGLKEFYGEMAFRKATWKDIQRAFEKASGRNLGWFFSQWVERAGAPGLKIGDAAIEEGPEGYDVTFVIEQTAPHYALKVPVVFTMEGGQTVTEVLDVKKGREGFAVSLSAPPLALELDPEYRVFRLLSDSEIPPSLSVFFGDNTAVIVVPSEKTARGKYSSSAELLSRDYGLQVVSDTSPGVEGYLKERSVLIMGGAGENKAFERVEKSLSAFVTFGPEGFKIGEKAFASPPSSLALAVKNPENPGKNICIFIGGGTGEEMLERAKRMRFFTKYSYIVLGEGEPEKGVFPGEKVLRHEFETGG